MAKTSFARPTESAPADKPAVPVDLGAITETSPTAVGLKDDLSPAPVRTEGAQVEGEIDFSDINLDRINLAQKSGNLSDSYDPGTYVLAKEVVLAKRGETFDFVVLKIKKLFCQEVPYDPSGGGPKPERYNTTAEVKAAGGHFNYDDRADGRYFRHLAIALILIPAPAGITDDERDNKFIYEGPGGIQYAIALWTLTKTSYTAAAKKIFTAGMIGHLKKGYEHGIWNCGSEVKSNAGNSWYQPILKPAGKTTEEFQAFAKEVLTTLA